MLLSLLGVFCVVTITLKVLKTALKGATTGNRGTIKVGVKKEAAV